MNLLSKGLPAAGAGILHSSSIPDGKILAMCGHPNQEDTRHNNTSLELFVRSPQPGGHWIILPNPVGDPLYPDENTGLEPDKSPYFPRLHVLPNGEIFCSTPLNRDRRKTIKINLTSGVQTEICDSPDDTTYDGYATTSVMLPILPEENYRPRILLCGGEKPRIIDLDSGTNISWQETAPDLLSTIRQINRQNDTISIALFYPLERSLFVEVFLISPTDRIQRSA